jgi:hypothetical protein
MIRKWDDRGYIGWGEMRVEMVDSLHNIIKFIV